MRIKSVNANSKVFESPWFLIPKPNKKADLRLFCFTYAGGNAEVYHGWTDYLPENVEMIAIQYPGRMKRVNEKPFTRMTELVKSIAEEIKPYINKPFAFMGHSMGALIAYELARHNRNMGYPMPRHLFLAARKAPHIQNVHPHIHKMSTEECISIIRSYDAVPEAVINNKELFALILPVIKGDFEMIETWEYEEDSLETPITAFGGINDTLANRQDMEAWKRFTTSDFKTYIFPEKHFFIHNEEVKKTMIAIISKTLQKYYNNNSIRKKQEVNV